MSFKRGCIHCDRGMIFLEAPHNNGQTYRPYMACDCEAGTVVAAHMEQVWELINNQGGDAYDGATRYSDRFGSLNGVKRGVVVAPREPAPGEVPEWVDDEGYREQRERMGA